MCPDWVIEIDAIGPCYLNEDMDGDPGRTTDINLADRFATENEARQTLYAVQRKFQNRKYRVVELHNNNKIQRTHTP